MILIGDVRIHGRRGRPSDLLLPGNGLGLLAVRPPPIPHFRIHWDAQFTHSIL